jgi:hypothetical protein
LKLNEAIREIDDPRLIQEIIDARNNTLNFNQRLQHHLNAVALYKVHVKLFKKKDARLGECLKRTNESVKTYNEQKQRRDSLPKQHRSREQQSFDLGYIAAFMSLDLHEAEILLGDVEKTMDSINFVANEINANARTLRELGDQKRSGYFRKKGASYPSFPQRPPLRPTSTDLLVGQDVERTEICHCVYCHVYVPMDTFDSATGKCKCEDYVHKKCGRMLTTRIRQGGDTREPYADRDRKMDKP